MREIENSPSGSVDESVSQAVEYSEQHWLEDAKSLGKQKPNRVSWEQSSFQASRSS